MPPVLYHVPRTISSPLAQILLELDLVNNPIEIRELTFADLKKSDHLAINPMGTSPAFTDAGITMWESGAILDYLLERYDSSGRFYPRAVLLSTGATTQQQLAQRAKFLQIKQFILATFYPFAASMYIHSLKNDADKEYTHAATQKCFTHFGPILTQWLGDGPYLLGDTISAVDFLLAKPLGNLHSMGILREFPSLFALYERIKSRPTYKEAYEGLNQQHCPSKDDRSLMMVPKEVVERHSIRV